MLRPGNVVLFHTPSASSHVELGLVLSCWKGVRMPKLHSSETRIDNCSAFRAVVLDKKPDSDAITEWYCNAKSLAWVVRIEALISILDCEACA